MQDNGLTATNDTAFLIADVSTGAAALMSGPPSGAVMPGAGRLPLLSDEIAGPFLQDVQCPWNALFEVSTPPSARKPVIMAREAAAEAVCLPV